MSEQGDLTPKQAKFCVEDKLHALGMLAKHIGMVRVGPLAPAPDMRAYIASTITPHVVADCFDVILDKESPPFARAACAAMVSMRYPNWRKVVPPEVLGFVVERESDEVRLWRNAVLKRDGRVCQKCGSTKALHAHHIVRWADSPEMRVVLSNGLTLCEPCHKEEHRGQRD